MKPKIPTVTLTLTAVFFLAMTTQILLPRGADAAEACPSDGITRVTSGSTATGATCFEAFSNLVDQERAKMDCDHGIYSYDFFHNGCHWNGSAYQTTGWYEYECQTDCNNPEV